jgi:Zn-dependent protease
VELIPGAVPESEAAAVEAPPFAAPTYGLPPVPTDAGLQPRPVGRIRRAFAPIGAALAAILKYGAVLWKLKVLIVVGSMLVSVAAYAWIWGWQFAVGFVLLIFIHEMGHVVALRRQGIRAGVPTFIPFLGAFVSMKSTPRDVRSEALSALAGPVTGSLAALGCWWIYSETHATFWLALAYTGFFLNLFNLLPALPLDGGRVAGALHPGIWLVGLLALLGWEIVSPSPVIPIVLLLGGYELYRRWRSRNTLSSRRYHDIPRGARIGIGSAYLGLVGALLLAMHATYLHRAF